jgi:hypothetical protein
MIEQSFKDILSFDGTFTREKESKSPRYTNVSDLLLILFQSVADDNPEILDTYLPKVIGYLLENGKSSRKRSAFWSNDYYMYGVSRFAQSISEYDSPRLPAIFFFSLIKPLMDK